MTSEALCGGCGSSFWRLCSLRIPISQSPTGISKQLGSVHRLKWEAAHVTEMNPYDSAAHLKCLQF